MLTHEFKARAIQKTAGKLRAQIKKPEHLQMKRADYIAFINGMLTGFEICHNVILSVDAKRDLVIDIMISSGVLNDVLL